MSTHWENDFGEEFETEEEARDDVYEKMDQIDLIEGLKTSISFTTLLAWAIKQPNFWDDFNDAVYEAENMFFHDNYHEVEDVE